MLGIKFLEVLSPTLQLYARSASACLKFFAIVKELAKPGGIVSLKFVISYLQTGPLCVSFFIHMFKMEVV